MARQRVTNRMPSWSHRASLNLHPHKPFLSGCPVIVDHSILIKFFISFKLSVQSKVDIGLMKIHFGNLQHTRDFEVSVVDIRSPFVESKLANFGKSAADRMFIQKI